MRPYIIFDFLTGNYFIYSYFQFIEFCISGKFCFGSCTMFKARTIVEFIENAVETSRSGRYLFFLNLRPVLGPVRVQLLYPVSRFMRAQSLQHMCRYVN